MSEREVEEHRGELIGRSGECAEIERVLEEARRGGSGTLVVRGEAGIGKTALLEHAEACADAMTVLRTTGVDAESDLGFAGLWGLVQPVIGKLDQLLEPRAEALAGALGIAPSRNPDRFLVSAAVLGLLAAAAEDQTVLCVVDDAQWLDQPSADALVFTARRLRAERVAMLFGAREGEARRFEAVGLPELWVGGVDEPSAMAILNAAAPTAASTVRSRLLADAAGNPLALLELPGGLSDAQLGGHDPLPEAIPLTPRLHGLFRERIERLPDPTQTALLIAATHFNEIAGELSIDPAGAVAGELRIDAASVDTGNKQRDKHLRSGDFFGAEEHPQVVFKPSAVRRIDGSGLEMAGRFTIAGHEEPVTLSLDASHSAAVLTLRATTVVDRRVFGMNWRPLGIAHNDATLTVEAQLTQTAG